MKQKDFIEKAKKIHGDKYDYSKVEYKGCNDEIIVIDKSSKKEIRVKPKYFLSDYIRITKEEKADAFIKKSKERFGDRFDYSKVRYVNSQTPVTLVCREHGEFDVNMYTHLYSKDGLCPFCNRSNINVFKRGGRERLSTDYIKRRCQKIYGDKYDYSKVEYKGGNAKTEVVEIICPVHGSFFKTYDNIQTRDCGCPKCAKEEKELNDTISNGENFIEKSKNKFGDRFVYSKVKYAGSQIPVTLICREHGMEFSVTPNSHLNSKFGGCKMCYDQYTESTRRRKGKVIKPKLTKEEIRERRIEYERNRFIEKAINKFGDRFDYSKVEYVDSNTPIRIIDKKSNNEIFLIKPSNFLHSVNGRINNMGSSLTTEEFIERARKLHGDKYDYSKVEYKNNKTRVCIICPEHGEFWQTPHDHLKFSRNCCGCPKCAKTMSKIEESVMNRLAEEGIDFNHNYINKKIFGDMRGDFFIKSHNVMIECQGRQHFEENNPLHRAYGGPLSGQIKRDYDFNRCCRDANISLFYYFNESDVKDIDYLNEKKYKGIYTEENTFTDINSLMSCIKRQ
jgi:hypothetical protein